MTSLNESYRSKRGPTDVLSFGHVAVESSASAASRGEATASAMPRPELASITDIGDVVLCRDAVWRSGSGNGMGDWDHFDRKVLIHGIVHLLGYDHENVPDVDSLAMQAREDELLQHLEDTIGPAGILTNEHIEYLRSQVRVLPPIQS